MPLKIYSTAEGLPHYVVNRIVRDSHGFLWFCTREGLSRFDGYDFTTYGVEHGLPAGNVTAFIETREGTHWLGTSAGLVRFDPAGRSTMEGQAGEVSGRMFTSYGAAENNPGLHVTSMAQDRSGTLWVGTGDGAVSSHDGRRACPARTRLTSGFRIDYSFFHYSITTGRPRRERSGLPPDTTSTSVHPKRGERIEQPPLPGDVSKTGTVNSLFEDRDGRIWAGTRGAGLWRLARQCVRAALSSSASTPSRTDSQLSGSIRSSREPTELSGPARHAA